jgi:phosphoglycolate phosphatase-like HAD superfamily hydrolase
MKKLVIYEFDNTLCVTRDSMYHRYNDVSEALKAVSLPISKFNEVNGMTTESAMRYLFNGQSDKAIEIYQNGSQHLDKIKPADGIEYTLNSLNQDCIVLAITSNRKPSSLKKVFDWLTKTNHTLEKYFDKDLILCYNDGSDNTYPYSFSKPKPSPESIEIILKNTQVSREEAIFVGDLPEDKMTAQFADVDFITFVPTHHQIPYALQDETIIRDHREILSLLD